MGDEVSSAEVESLRILLTGATGQIGQFLLPLLARQGCQIAALSRQPPRSDLENGNIRWQQGDLYQTGTLPDLAFDAVVSAGPLDAFAGWLERQDRVPPRVVAFGSTSAFTKRDSSDAAERALAARLADSEDKLRRLAERHEMSVTVLRPTLIYGGKGGRNLSRIVTLARRFHGFVLPFSATGKRQPVHAEDLAQAAFAALQRNNPSFAAYDLPGGETLAYGAMVRRLLAALDPPLRLWRVPDPFWRGAMKGLRALGMTGDLPLAALDRLQTDLVFDSSLACRDLGFKPRPFQPETTRLENAG